MKLKPLILAALLTGLCRLALCQGKSDSVAVFRIYKAAPEIKTIYSKSNALYGGDNPLVLSGIDSAHIGDYYLYASQFIPIYKKKGMFYLRLTTDPVASGLITMPGELRVFIYKVNMKDTALIGSQEMDITPGELPCPIVMAGANPVTPGHERRRDLINNPQLSLVSSNSDYSSCFKVTSFCVTVGSVTYACKGNSLSAQLLDALKSYHGRYVTVGYVYASTPDGIPVCFIDNSKR